jgi:hypothetical protein
LGELKQPWCEHHLVEVSSWGE